MTRQRLVFVVTLGAGTAESLFWLWAFLTTPTYNPDRWLFLLFSLLSIVAVAALLLRAYDVASVLFLVLVGSGLPHLEPIAALDLVLAVACLWLRGKKRASASRGVSQRGLTARAQRVDRFALRAAVGAGLLESLFWLVLLPFSVDRPYLWLWMQLPLLSLAGTTALLLRSYMMALLLFFILVGSIVFVGLYSIAALNVVLGGACLWLWSRERPSSRKP